MLRVQDELPGGRFVFGGVRRDVAQILTWPPTCSCWPSRGEGMSHVINEAGAAGASRRGIRGRRRCRATGRRRRRSPRPVRRRCRSRCSVRDARGPTAEISSELGGGSARVACSRHTAPNGSYPEWQALFDEVVRRSPSHIDRSHRPFGAFRKTPCCRSRAEIQIETNTACNATCIMCPYPEVAHEMRTGQLDVRGGRMDPGLYQKILDECAERAVVAPHRAVPQQRAVHGYAHRRLDRHGEAARFPTPR